MAGVHWLTAGTSRPMNAVEHVMGRLGDRERGGRFGQPFKRVHESGAAVYFGSDVPGQPLVIDAPGEICETWAPELLEMVRQVEGWITRVDLAEDVNPPELARRRIIEMRKAFKSGRCKTRMRKGSCRLVQNDAEDEGWTLYLGSKHAEIMFRVYDRRGPLRIEPQWRPSREMGEQLPELLIDNGATQMWRALARTVEFPMPWYQELIRGKSARIEHEARVDAGFLQLMDQLRKQFGVSFWALRELGITLDDLAVPPKRLRGSQAAKLLDWADAAHAQGGYDGEKLRRAVKQRCE
jgi:hypothetical protein